MFYRKLLHNLNIWRNKADRKPLVLRGTRQVGKTTLVLEFAKTFSYSIILNLEKAEHRQLLESPQPFSHVVNRLLFEFKIPKSNNPTLLFIDEIQNSPKAVALLRYFYEEAPWLHVIAAGSLLESLIDNHISFPVGRVEFMAVRPCSFEEYLGAMGEQLALDALNQWPFPLYAHESLIKHFNRYTLIGGMPAIVANYATNNDMVLLQPIFSDLLSGYSDDVEKYARNHSQVNYIRHILKTGLSAAGQRIKFERFGSSDYRSREMGEAFRVLEKAMLLELVYPSISTQIPIQPDYKKSPRLQWFDTGLVNYSAGMQGDIMGANDILDVWKGRVAEHITAQELIANDVNVRAVRNFWVRESKNSNAEVDFVMQHNGLIIPIEVKSGKSGQMKSLHLFMEAAKLEIAIKVSSAPINIELVKSPNGKVFTLIHLPFYLVSRLLEIVGKM